MRPDGGREIMNAFAMVTDDEAESLEVRIAHIERALDGGWRIERRVSLAVIVTILFAVVGLATSEVQRSARTDARIETLERQIVEEHERDRSMERTRDEADTALERRSVEAVNQLRSQMDRIDAKLDRLILPRGRQP